MPVVHADRSLAARVESALAKANVRYATAYNRLFPGEGAGYERISDAAVTFAGLGSPLNRATALGMATAATANDVDRVERFLTDRGSPPRIDLCPLADERLPRLLGERGYRIDYFLNINVLPLTSGDNGGDVGRSRSDDSPMLTRLAADDPVSAALWADTVGNGFADHGPASPDDRRIYLSTYASSQPWLASIDGQAAGGGALRVIGATALLSTASTVPAFRRRGVQTALMHARLDAAREVGCDLAMVLTTPGSDSERNVARLGFRTVYTDVVMVRGDNQ